MVRWEQSLKSWQGLKVILTGRSVSSCMVAWNQIHANVQTRFTAPVQPMVSFEQPSPQNASKPKKRRPASGDNVSSAVDRVIQPQLPFNFPSVNTPGDPAADQGVTAPVLGGPPKKKRGRPSKVEYEAKVAEAAARGEKYQPTPKRKKAPQPSLQGAPNASMVPPMSEGSASKARAQKPKARPDEAGGLASDPTARSLALEASALATDQMQIEKEKPFKSTIPETQASEFEARRTLAADIRENAERTALDTVQSTMTLRHDSTPGNDFTFYQGPTRDSVTRGEQQLL